jgi:hypothetical protein
MQSKLLGATIGLAVILAGCTSIAGTRDKSSTFQRSVQLRDGDSIAVLPIQEDAGMPGLSSKIETALIVSLQSQFPWIVLLDAQTTVAQVASHELIGSYGQWRAGYEFTGMIDHASFDPISTAINAKYFLVVHSPHLAGEKMRASDTGYAGYINDANNRWRTDLQFAAELIDARSKQIAWKGDGHAEHIHSPKESNYLFFVVINDRNSEMPEYVDEMITAAAQGLARQIGAGQAIPSKGAPIGPATQAFPPQGPTRTVDLPPSGSRIRCPSLGADMTAVAIAGMVGIDGVTGAMVSRVLPNSAAAAAGIREGDIVIRVGDAPINDPDDVHDAVCRVPAGAIIDVKLSREARPLWVSVQF